MENKNNLPNASSTDWQDQLEKLNLALRLENQNLKQRISALEQESIKYNEIIQSFAWKMTKPQRTIGTAIKRAVYYAKRFMIYLQTEGIKATFLRIKNHCKNKGMHAAMLGTASIMQHAKNYISYCAPTPQELQYQKNFSFSNPKTFSIIVPLYNTPEVFLREMINSVLAQSYPYWELCLADGSDNEHSIVQKICLEYANNNPRIKYKKLEQNGGISANTNAALELSTGEYIALFDHDDLLAPSVLFKLMEAVQQKNADFIYTDEMTFEGDVSNCVFVHCKPDFSPETLRGYNYICHFTAFSRELYNKVGNFNSEFDGSQDYDMILRLTEQAKNIVHIPEVLYYWRSHSNSVAGDISAKPYCLVAAKKALSQHLKRVGLSGNPMDTLAPSIYRIMYTIHETPLISIIIANKDHTDDLNTCLRSIYSLTTYPNFEVIVVENNSTEDKTFAYYEQAKKEFKNLSVVDWGKGEFNYSSINNFGVSQAKGEYILLLNNDIEVLSADWLEAMLMFAQMQNVGAVGTKLLYPDGTIQHGGVILGYGGIAGHAFIGWPRYDFGYASRLTVAQNVSAVTAACLLTKKSVWEQVGGLDEGFKVAFNDVDFCMQVRKAGYDIIFTPFAELYHHESKSRGYEDTKEKQERFNGEIKRFAERWQAELQKGDPYYNPNLDLYKGSYNLKLN